MPQVIRASEVMFAAATLQHWIEAHAFPGGWQSSSPSVLCVSQLSVGVYRNQQEFPKIFSQNSLIVINSYHVVDHVHIFSGVWKLDESNSAGFLRGPQEAVVIAVDLSSEDQQHNA